MLSVDLMSLWTFVCSVHLCYSVRNRTHPRYEKMSIRFAGEFFLSRRIFLSLTELTDLTEHFCALFRTHRTPPAYRYHRTFQLKVTVTFCEIGWLNVSVKPCVFCSSVIFCERKIVGYSQWGVLSLTERTEFTEHFGAHFEPTERLRHTEFTEAFQLRLAVTLCDIGWLNVSVGLCVFCSSV